MGGNKRLLEEDEAKRYAAVQFAIELGVLERCEYHDDVVFEGSGDLDAAYRAAAASYKRGEHSIFASQREFTDYIKLVVRDHPADECPSCDRLELDSDS